MKLVATLGEDGKYWNQVKSLIEKQEWEKIFLIGSEQIKKFGSGYNFIIIDEKEPVESVIKKLTDDFRKINDVEVQINIVSGSGKIHMALLAALIKAGLGFRLVAVTREGVKEI